MENFNVSDSLESDAGEGDVSITKYFKGFAPQSFNGGAFPLLSLPQDFSSYTFSKSKISVNDNDLLLPEIDTILTEYCSEFLQAYFTIEFIELVNQKPLTSIFSVKDERLEYAVSLYITICNLPALTPVGEIRKTLSFYLANPYSLLSPGWQHNTNNLANLKASLHPAAKTYLDKLVEVELPNEEPARSLGSEWAMWFIDKADVEMEKDLIHYFDAAKIRASLLNANG